MSLPKHQYDNFFCQIGFHWGGEWVWTDFGGGYEADVRHCKHCGAADQIG